MKHKILLVYFFCLIIPFSFLVTSRAIADDTCSTETVQGQKVQSPQTISGNVQGLENYHLKCSDDGYSFSISSNSGQTITAGSSTTIIVEGGIGPYTWEINSNGYSWESGSGVTISETPAGNRSKILYCDSGT